MTSLNSTIGFINFRHYQPLLLVSVNELAENGEIGITFGCGDTIATKHTSGEWKHNFGYEPSL